jgi:hypothetical protein
MLNSQTVLNYVFLAQFDLLREGRHQVQNFVWSQAAQRETITSYFKLQRSKEELERVNMEAHRLRTSIHDEEQDLT